MRGANRARPRPHSPLPVLRFTIDSKPLAGDGPLCEMLRNDGKPLLVCDANVQVLSTGLPGGMDKRGGMDDHGAMGTDKIEL